MSKQDMETAHVEGYHDDASREGCPLCVGPRRYGTVECWPLPCEDYHATWAHTSGEDPCTCRCHG